MLPSLLVTRGLRSDLIGKTVVRLASPCVLKSKSGPNHALQRTGGQRGFVAWWSRRWSVVVLPPPLSSSVDMTSDVKSWGKKFSGCVLHVDVLVVE